MERFKPKQNVKKRIPSNYRWRWPPVIRIPLPLNFADALSALYFVKNGFSDYYQKANEVKRQQFDNQRQ